jgi:D-aspartate ligase
MTHIPASRVVHSGIGMEQMMQPALVLGSHTVGLGITRALGSMGVPVVAVQYDDRDMGHVSKYVTHSMRAPHPETSEDEFIALLIDRADRFEGSFLVPSTDATLAAVSRHKDLLERHYIVACTDWEITKLYVDKRNTYALANQVGVAVPKTAIPHSIEDVEGYARSALYPCLVKPCQGHQYYDVFRKKMVNAHNLDQLVAAYREAADVGLEVMLQEFIPGGASEGVNYNSYSWGGETLVEFTAAKLRNAPRDTGSPCCNMSAVIPEVIEPGRKILQAMGFYGYACTEFKRDPRDGVYKTPGGQRPPQPFVSAGRAVRHQLPLDPLRASRSRQAADRVRLPHRPVLDRRHQGHQRRPGVSLPRAVSPNRVSQAVSPTPRAGCARSQGPQTIPQPVHAVGQERAAQVSLVRLLRGPSGFESGIHDVIGRLRARPSSAWRLLRLPCLS